MAYKRLHLFFILESISVLMCFAADSCTKTDSCSCSLADGTSIDLHPLADSDKFAFPYTVAESGDGFEYAWNPCNPVSDTSQADCTNAASCRRTIGGSDGLNIGTQDSANFDSSDTNLLLKYQNYASDGNLYDVWVDLICDTSTTSDFSVQGESGFLIFRYTLKSKCCCPDGCKGGIGGGGGGLSFGSILCIIFSVLLVVYIAVGISFSVYKGKSGVEMVPNLAFWKDFPFLVKDGCQYVGNFFKNLISGRVDVGGGGGVSKAPEASYGAM
ncbi:putative cation-dependent mannose-6-phosphate receptor-like [Apostichopus japonicus]|uniref:Putative cation-dependent mannose-6-phosphate receptor-like n=1 Tax=Stichopus japonicus TaxID=307972 RepID=A0A2G8LMC3_STIJA|nr:putative cation-dependent mannose-6-phosphate receptor-like [Apostichopus japonicus]